MATRQAPDARVWIRLLPFRVRVPCGVVVFMCAVTSSQQGRHADNSRLLIYLLYYLQNAQHSKQTKENATVARRRSGPQANVLGGWRTAYTHAISGLNFAGCCF